VWHPGRRSTSDTPNRSVPNPARARRTAFFFLPRDFIRPRRCDFFYAAYRENTRKPMARWGRLRVRATGCIVAVVDCSSQFAPLSFFCAAAALTKARFSSNAFGSHDPTAAAFSSTGSGEVVSRRAHERRGGGVHECLCSPGGRVEAFYRHVFFERN